MPYSLADSCVFLSSVFIIHQCWRVMKIVAFSSKRRQRPGFLSSSAPFCSPSPRSFFSVVSAIVWNCVVLHGIRLRHFGNWTAFTITDYLVNASINSLTGIVEAIRAEKCITRRVYSTCVHSGGRDTAPQDWKHPMQLITTTATTCFTTVTNWWLQLDSCIA